MKFAKILAIALAMACLLAGCWQEEPQVEEPTGILPPFEEEPEEKTPVGNMVEPIQSYYMLYLVLIFAMIILMGIFIMAWKRSIPWKKILRP